MRPIIIGSIDQSVNVRILTEASGTPHTSVTTSAVTLWYRREGGSVTSITPVALGAPSSVHEDGGFIHISDGYYRVDPPDAAWAIGSNGVMIGGGASGAVMVGAYVPLLNFDVYTPYVTIASGGLDIVHTTVPTSGLATTFTQQLNQLWRRAFKKSTLTNTYLTTYADNGTTPLTQQAVSDDGITQILNAG